MARGSAGKSGGMSRIRFVMVDAEIPDGQMGSVTQAIQNALRGPAPVTVQRITGSASNGASHDANSADDAAVEADVVEQEVDEAPARERTSRKPAPTPNVIPIEMDADVSLATFAQGKDSKSNHKRFLIAAAWLKEHRNIDAVGADHIYTCFRKLGWPTGIPDFGQPLRELKSRKFFTTPGRGMYAINHIGLDYVKKLNGTA